MTEARDIMTGGASHLEVGDTELAGEQPAASSE